MSTPPWTFSINIVSVWFNYKVLWIRKINTFYSLMSASGFLRCLSLRCSLASVVSEKKTFVDLSRSVCCLCEVPNLSPDAGLRAIEMLQEGATQEHYSCHILKHFQLHSISARRVCIRLWERNIRPYRPCLYAYASCYSNIIVKRSKPDADAISDREFAWPDQS